MADIFDGLKELSDDDIRLLISMLRNVNLYNSVVETSSRAVNRLIGFAGSILSSFNPQSDSDDSEIINVKIRRVKDRIKETYASLAAYDRIWLDDELKKELSLKSGLITDIQSPYPSDEYISVKTVQQAASAYGIDIRQPACVLGDLVKEKYYERFLKVLHEKLVREDAQERNATDYACTMVLRKVPVERIRELASVLAIKEFNPKGIMNAVRRDRTTYTLDKVITAMGVEAFDPQSCIIRTVNDGYKSLISSDKMLLSNIIWTAQSAYGKKFTPASDLMPSFSTSGKSVGISELDARYMNGIKREDELERVIKKLLKNTSDNNKRIAEYEDALMQARIASDELLMDYEEKKRLSDEAQEKMKREKKHLEDYETIHPSAASDNIAYKSLKSDAQLAQNEARQAQYECDRTQKELERKKKREQDIRDRLNECEKKATEYGNLLYENSTEYNELVFFTENETKERSGRLKAGWKKVFTELDFDINIYDYMVKYFGSTELVLAELYLYELNNAFDTEAFSHDVITGEDGENSCVAYCLVSAGKYAQINYKAKNILSITVKNR